MPGEGLFDYLLDSFYFCSLIEGISQLTRFITGWSLAVAVIEVAGSEVFVIELCWKLVFFSTTVSVV
jgi:hypothetical protein